MSQKKSTEGWRSYHILSGRYESISGRLPRYLGLTHNHRAIVKLGGHHPKYRGSAQILETSTVISPAQNTI